MTEYGRRGDEPLVLDSCHDHVIAAWQRVAIVVWRRHTSVEGIAALRRLLTHFKDSPQPVALVTIVEQGAPPPSTEARKQIAELMQDGSTIICCSAVILEGEGFRAAMVRSVATGLALLASLPFPYRVLDLESTLALLSRHLGEADFNPAAFMEALRFVRTQ